MGKLFKEFPSLDILNTYTCWQSSVLTRPRFCDILPEKNVANKIVKASNLSRPICMGTNIMKFDVLIILNKPRQNTAKQIKNI